MLQYARVLPTAALKRTSRTCSWITIQQSTSSNIVVSKDENTEFRNSSKNDPDYKVGKSFDFIKKYISADLNIHEENINQLPILEVDNTDAITTKNNLREILNYLKKLQDLKNDSNIEVKDQHFEAIIRCLNKIDFETLKMFMSKLNMNSINNLLTEDNISEELVIEILKNFDMYESIKLLSKLAVTKCRPTPLLQTLASNITNSKHKIGEKQLADILYSICVLNFYNDSLIQYLINNLIKNIPTSNNNIVIGMIIRSLGTLRIRNKALLDMLSVWIVEHQNILKPHDITNFLVTLASLGYTTVNFHHIVQYFVIPMSQIKMKEKFEWLDTVWALTILDKATLKNYQSILNDNFLKNLFDDSTIITSKAIKVLNINGAASLNVPKCEEESLLSENSFFFEVPLKFSKEKMKFSASIIKALKLLLPGDSKYLNVNINNKMGFLIDAEFCVDDKLTPYPISFNAEKKIHRIAVLSVAYNELCYGLDEIGGRIKFYSKLLERQGYKVLLLRYSEKLSKESTMNRAKYIIEQLKLLIKN